MFNMRKKSVLTIISLATALTVVIGGTFAYLQDSSETVRNEFEKNKVEVDLTESTDGYDIVPGTSQEKDPTVSGEATLPTYVFVQVEDETNGLVTYEIADGWTQLADVPGVYYREVEDGDFEFGVLKGDKVTYSDAITNADMDAAGDDVALSFTAHAIQKAPFADAAEAWDAIVNGGGQAEEDLPDASLTPLNPEEIGMVEDMDNGWSGNLDVAVNFGANDTAADIAEKEYKDWTVDFVLSFNKAIDDGSKVHLFGNYGTYGWLGDDLAAGGKQSLAAGEELKIMSEWFLPAIGMGDGVITYNDVVTLIQSFDCGIAVEDQDLAEGLVATLKLIMIDDEGTTHVIDSGDYAVQTV